MKIFFYKAFNFLFWAFLFLAFFLLAIIILAIYTGNTSPYIADIVNVFTITLSLIIIFGFIRLKFLSIFAIKKYLRIKRYNMSLNKVKKLEEKNRNNLSDRSNKQNICPLVKIVKKELTSRKRYIAPNILERTERIVRFFEKENNVIGVNDFYNIITGAENENLNLKITEYLANKELEK